MEDKFGYLMKQEFEEDFLEQVSDYMKQNSGKVGKDSGLYPWDIHNRVVMSWGGNHEKDKEIYKIR